jgi:hypothetical protein
MWAVMELGHSGVTVALVAETQLALSAGRGGGGKILMLCSQAFLGQRCRVKTCCLDVSLGRGRNLEVLVVLLQLLMVASLVCLVWGVRWLRQVHLVQKLR